MIPSNVLNFMSRCNINTNELQNLQTPDDVAQFLLNSGRVSQAQVNQAKQMWNNPQIQQRFQHMGMGKRY